MSSNSLFIYKASLFEKKSLAEYLFKRIMELPEEPTSFFEVQMISNSQLEGKYVIIENYEEQYYIIESREFETRINSRPIIINFEIEFDIIKVWGNKQNAKKLVLALSKLLNNIVVSSFEINLVTVLNNILKMNIEIGRVVFSDILLTEDIVGNFSVDLSNNINSKRVVEKLKNKVDKITFIIKENNKSLRIGISKKGNIMVYQKRELIDYETLMTIDEIFLKEV